MESNYTLLENNSHFNLEINEDEKQIFPWIINLYYFILCIGFILNFCLSINLLLQKKNGTSYIILQFALIDILSIWIAVIEISSISSSNWPFSFFTCPLFLGTEVLVNVSIIYLHILLNFHAISAWNIQKKAEQNKNPLTSKVEESEECLVWPENFTPNRTLNIDYRHKKSSVSILIPSLLIWFTCLSLSVPKFTLSTTVYYHTNITLCTIVDHHYNQLLHFLLIFFRDILPNPLLLITFIIAAFNLVNSTSLSRVKKNCSAKKFSELKRLLQLSAILNILYIFLSFQRSIIHCFYLIFKTFDKTALINFKIPPLDNFVTNTYLSMLHYSAAVFRPIFCMYILPIVKIFFIKPVNKN